MTDTLDLFCDESGLTGPNLLDDDQRLFTYAGVLISDDEAWRLIDRLRRTHYVLDDELKAKDMLKADRGKAFVLDLLRELEGRYQVVAYDKATALCAKLADYVYEPVFRSRPDLLYGRNLHRFITMYCYVFLVSRDDIGAESMRQFLRFMRSYDPAVAPLLFAPTGGATAGFAGNPFEMVTSFARGYRDVIVADNQSERDADRTPGTLTLDLTSPALFSLLCAFGRRGRPLAVTCDENRQLEEVAESFTGGDDDPSIRRARQFNPDEPIGYRLSRPIRFQVSQNSPGLQVADLVAGTAGCVGRMAKRGLDEHIEAIDRHIHPHAIFPDFDVVKPNGREAMVNWTVLFGLGERAKAGENPFTLLEEIYVEAERAWDRGELRMPSGAGS